MGQKQKTEKREKERPKIGNNGQLHIATPSRVAQAKNIWVGNSLGSELFFVKNIWVRIIFGSKKSWVGNFVGYKKNLGRKFGLAKFLVGICFGSKEFGPKNVLKAL